MRTEVRMPNLGSDMDSGKISAWLKKVGDPVERGEVMAEVETDKAIVDMEALASGTLAEIVADVGAEITVGDVIAYLET
jgi:pyruvate dehydrogenase E2 component (dihydrolipoamide acetyltransferase)